MVDGKYYFLFYVNLGRTTAIFISLFNRASALSYGVLSEKKIVSLVSGLKKIVFLDLKRKTPRAPSLDHT